ncbi:hypothetical protein CAT59_07265 [Acinetobacter pittii]|jgi:hypothetical protein|uniref:Uncharacterized protein n=1 Tax=Acinetobacter pittii TaxID=48296 RepID=A0A242U5K8_ACIPI|nr:hypothetical protein [Acinetobacter pittii]OTU28350.1 hypothetical protein CAT59_07265 [Acinetobacter pittii]
MTTENSKDNLHIWNAVKQTPTNFLKKIEFGYLKGKSDINPQWRLMAMTQAFGPVGHGWTYRIVKLWSEPCTDGSVMAFAEVAVKTKLDGVWGEEFSGIGGSTIVDKNKNGISANDEGFKKAVTDALGVAFKAIGVAADVYLGNFDGSKYLNNFDQAFPANEPQAHSHKPQRTQDQLYQDALKAIKDAPDTNILNAAIKKFKGTTYESGITRACQARADQMGWAPKNITQQAQSLHH